MKTHFIRIDDISELDPSRATVYDLNNRYIDSRGNMYGLRYNRKNKKIEVIKIIRTPAKTASYYQQRLVQHRRNTQKDEHHKTADSDQLGDTDIGEQEGEGFSPRAFIDKTLERIKIHRDRLSGMAMNIKNSKIVPETDRMEYNTLNNIFRSIDIDGIKRIDKILDNHKELVSYPRSINYYQSKLDTQGRAVFDSLPTDSRQMQFIFYFEMFHSVKNLYTALHKILKDIEFFLTGKDPENMKHLTFAEKQNFYDANISIENTMKEVIETMRDLRKLEEFIYDSENF